jgi:lipopolysaccharide biosynthesis glycosyltransferase
MKKNLIITASDSKYYDFVKNIWLKSLKDNVNLKDIDILILDYGFTEEQRQDLIKQGIKIYSCKKDGAVVIIRYRDCYSYLKDKKYKTLLACDSDLIFQDDISELFKRDIDQIKTVCEDIAPPMNEFVFSNKVFSNELTKEMRQILKAEKMVNGGMIVAPREKFLQICQSMNNLIQNKSLFGPDQTLLNYLLYKQGFLKLDKTYNFVLTTVYEGFNIENGVFYDIAGKKIKIVHNAGGSNIFRPVDNFGYGPEYNKKRFITYHLLRIFYRMNFLTNLFLRTLGFFK